MSSASNRNALDGRSVQRVTLYDGGGTPLTPTSGGSLPVTQTKVPLTAVSPNTALVTASSSQILAANAARTGLILTHLGTSGPVSVSFGVTTNLAVLNSGLTLVPNEKWGMYDYGFTTAAVNAIATASGARISIQEWQ